MDISSIASVAGLLGGVAISDGATADESEQDTAPVLWPLDETGWPIDEEGWPLDGQLVPQADGQLNFVKGKGKGENKGCHNCGDLTHYIRDCPKPRTVDGKGKGKGCHNCGDPNHFIRECPKGKGKGKGKSLGYAGKRELGPELASTKHHKIAVLAEDGETRN